MPVTLASLVWLFDIDGTLLLTKGAGREALMRALLAEYGIEDDLKSIPFAGRTDLLIVGDIAAKHGLDLGDGALRRFFKVVAGHMRTLMDPPRGGLLPGVEALLRAIASEPAWVTALLTGNESEMARIKLEAFGIHDAFAWGAFGDEAPDRNELAKLAVRRAAERHGVPPDRCVVVGDTEHDIACARAAGAKVVAVATGSQSSEVLGACGPDLLVENFESVRPILQWIRTQAGLESTR
jgi:phosphoglycolate phosphatase